MTLSGCDCGGEDDDKADDRNKDERDDDEDPPGTVGDALLEGLPAFKA